MDRINETLIYLAARYSRRQELCSYRSQLESNGFIVTSRWLNGSHQIDNNGHRIGKAGEAAVERGEQIAAHCATEDLADMDAADWFLAFTEEPRSGSSRGGRHVEFGYALAKGKTIGIVGPRENVFCWLPQITVFDSFALAHSWLRVDM